MKNNGEFPIERGVPIPEARTKTKYPWREMEIGESFLAPKSKENSLSACACNAAKKLKRRFVLRTVEGGVRVWRVE